MLPDRNPAVLGPLDKATPGPSLRGRLGGRADTGVAPFAVVCGFDGGRVAEGGARFADMEGEGDDRDATAPFVCMPGGIGRLTLVGPGTTGEATTVGAIETAPASERQQILEAQPDDDAWARVSQSGGMA